MEIWQEPVRGAVLPPAAYALSGLERLRGYGRRLFPSTPLHHLVGFRTTQASNGSAVGSMPLTHWLAHPDGVIDNGLLAFSVSGLAAYTVLPPRTRLDPLHMTYQPVRTPSSDARTLVGRSHVVRTSPDWVYVEGSVEDDAGRVIADASGHLKITPVDFPVPDAAPDFEPVEPPQYPIPDPYQRPLPADKYDGIEQFHTRGCVGAFRAIASGELPTPPLYELGGIRPLEAETGAITTELTTSLWLQGSDAGFFPGWMAAFATDACGAVTRSLEGPEEMPAILQVSMAFLRPVPVDGRTLVARARGETAGELVLTVVDVFDGDNRVATGSMTARWVPTRERSGQAATRALATVLFTDIVGSTEQAERLGDSKWRSVLSRHEAMARSEIEHLGGRLVKSTGDGVLATFDSPTAAVACARRIRDGVRALGVEIRAGVHTGEVEISGGDIAGIAVHTAARIEAAAGPGEVWVSETVLALTTGADLTFKDRGRHALKGIEDEVQLYSVEE